MKKLMSVALSSVVAILILGCTPVGRTSAILNNIVYIPYSPLVSSRFDSLYETDGTANGTFIISNSFIPNNTNTNYSKIENFMKDGSLLYIETEYEDSNTDFFGGYPLHYGLLGVGTTLNSVHQINTNMTLISALKGFPHPKYMTGNGLFLYDDGNTPNYREMVKVSGATVTPVTNNTAYKPDYLGYSAKVGDDIYLSASIYPQPTGGTNIGDYTILKLNTSTNEYEHISVLDGYQMLSLTKNGDFIYFIANNSNINAPVLKIFKYNITTPNTPPVLVNGNINQSSNYLYTFNNSIYFVSHIATNSTTITGKIHKLDLNTNQVSTLISVPYALNEPQSFGKFVEYNNSLYLVSKNHLFKINSSNAVDLTQSMTIPDNVVYEANGKLYFGADDGTHGVELWQYDGTAVTLAKDINTGPGDSIPRHITELNGDIILQASDDGVNNHLFKFDSAGNLTLLH